MTDRAPGLDGPKNEGGCFNCGSQDHFAYACPEPTRKEPYGAGVFRQLQAEKTTHTHGGAGRGGSDNARPKGGLVVTRYGPPPPPQYPPHANAWGPGGPYPPPASFPAPPPNPYGQPPPLPYPPPTQAQPPYPPPYPPASGVYRPPVPPPPAPSPSYGQYGQPPYQQPPPPPPSSYGPPAPYAPPPSSYPPPYPQSNPPYPGAPPLGYPAPPPPAPPPTYAPGYGAAAPPVPPPPPPAPYLPASFPPPPHASGFDAPAPYPSPYPPPPPPNQGWQPDSNGHNSQRQRDRRDRRNDRDKGPKNRTHRRDNDSNQRGRGHRHDAPGPRPPSRSRQRTPKPSVVAQDEKSETPKTESLAEAEGQKEAKEAELDDDFAWDLEKSFVKVDFKPADPVGKPLAAEWNDHPTIPPAYDAKCIKSAFYDPDNPDAILASVRDTKYWSDLKRDPVFRFRRGMVAVQFTGSHHEYFTYPCPRRVGTEWHREREILPMPSDASLNDAIKPRSAHPPPTSHHQGDASSYTNDKRGHRESDDYWRDAKRARPSTGRERSPSKYFRRPSPRDTDLQGDSWALQAGEARIDSPQRPYSRDGNSRSPGYRLQNGDRLGPHGSTQRHDSGYHSAHSAEKHRFQRNDKGPRRHLSPPPSVRLRDREASHDHGRGWDQGGHGRDRDRDRGRSPSNSRPRSRARSPTIRVAGSDDESGMSDLEYELLGMQRPRKKVAPPKPPTRKPRVKVNDAFGRRW